MIQPAKLLTQQLGDEHHGKNIQPTPLRDKIAFTDFTKVKSLGILGILSLERHTYEIFKK